MTLDATVYNAIAGAASLFFGALVVAVFARAAKRGDSRAAAETAMWNITPQIIREQNARLDQLSKDFDRQHEEINRLWAENYETRRRERECQDDLSDAKNRIANLEGRIQ